MICRALRTPWLCCLDQCFCLLLHWYRLDVGVHICSCVCLPINVSLIISQLCDFGNLYGGQNFVLFCFLWVVSVSKYVAYVCVSVVRHRIAISTHKGLHDGSYRAIWNRSKHIVHARSENTIAQETATIVLAHLEWYRGPWLASHSKSTPVGIYCRTCLHKLLNKQMHITITLIRFTNYKLLHDILSN